MIPVMGGALVWGTINPPTIINPVLTSHSVSSALLSLLFDSLVREDHLGNIVPGLAESWIISDDGLVYTFHLHPHVYFHDGVECTAQDVKFTYEAINDPLNQSPWRSGLELISRWEIIDRYTLRIVLKRTFPGLLFKLTREIIPQHLYEHSNFLMNPHNYSPVGTGPFRFLSFNKESSQIVLGANDSYFEGRPFLDKIVIKIYGNNSDLWAALMRGEVDFCKFLNWQDYKVLSKDRAFKTYEIPTGLYDAIIYNLHDPVLSDRELRHAISYAVDRKALMQSVSMEGVESNGPFYPKSPWFNKSVEAPSYNPLRAKLMLAWGGWALGSDGILKKGKQSLILTMLVDRNRQYYRQMAFVLHQQLSEVGIGLKIVFYNDENQLTPEFLAQVKPQMWLRMFQGDSRTPFDVAQSWYSGSSEFARLWPYQNAAIDRLFLQSMSLKNENSLAGVYQRMHALIYEDQPACFYFLQLLTTQFQQGWLMPKISSQPICLGI